VFYFEFYSKLINVIIDIRDRVCIASVV